MTTKHTVRTGESLLSIAKHYGFGSTDPFEQHPDNQPLLAERGTDGLYPGDELTVPDGWQGEAQRGTGRGHQFTVRRIPNLFEVRVFTELRKEDPREAGFKFDDPENIWRPFGSRGLTEINAQVEIKLLHGKVTTVRPGGLTNSKTGIFSTEYLSDGKWQIKLTPLADQFSPGPARANPGEDHGRGFYETEGRIATRDGDNNPVPPPRRPYPVNKRYEVEYRPLDLEIEVKDGEIVRAGFSGPPAASRPHHAVLLWKNLQDTENKQVLEIDWKPDFLRRVVVKLGPRHRVRDTDIDIVMFHHTGGTNIGAALTTFLSSNSDNSSGAHFLIDLDGHVIRLADDLYQLKHGGGGGEIRPPSWRGVSSPSINQRSVGIEHVHTDDDLNEITLSKSAPYSDAQYKASMNLIASLMTAYSVSAADVIGHQDAVSKSMCPGRMVDWAILEKSKVALAPLPLTVTEQDSMFGGLYAGQVGRARRLLLGQLEKEGIGGFEVYDGDNLVVGGLVSGPIAVLREAVRQIGYSVENWIVVKGTKHELTPSTRPFFDPTLGYALSQLIRHYCTLGRVRADMYFCYREIPRVWDGLFVDFKLATLIRGLEKAAIAARGGPI
jgi:N-acetyl-anhydromuramyl-L-alanine amidase AmpD